MDEISAIAPKFGARGKTKRSQTNGRQPEVQQNLLPEGRKIFRLYYYCNKATISLGLCLC